MYRGGGVIPLGGCVNLMGGVCYLPDRQPNVYTYGQYKRVVHNCIDMCVCYYINEPNQTMADYSKLANSPKDYSSLAKEARRTVLGMIHRAQTSHIASNLSVIDIATVLYENLKEGDEVVWSPTWKAATIYYFLAKQGKIPVKDLDLFYKEIVCEKCSGDGYIGDHEFNEDCGKCRGTGKVIPYLGLAETNVPGVWCNGGSVGHGLPIAVGMALAKKRAGEEGTIYCILSDGELNEGSVWEAAMLAAHHKLDNLVAIVDANGWQAMGKTEDVCDINATEAFGGFGWYATLIDGHNHHQLEDIFTGTPVRNLYQKPEVFVAKTIKGRGVSFMENHLLYHYKNISDDEYEKAMAELV